MEDQNSASEATVSHPRPNSSHQDDDGTDDPSRKRQNIRKRTKTGCLTCRKRRIKCDEGRPTCNNCIKSKRQCEGYSQRVIFKDPMGTMQDGGPYGPVMYPNSDQVPNYLQIKSSHGSLATIAPKPSNAQFPGGMGFQFGSYSQPVPLSQPPQPPPPTYDFNQGPTNSNPFLQQNPYVAPQSQPGYVTAHHGHRQPHHFGNPPSAGSHDLYATARRPSVTLPLEDEPSSITKPENTTLDYDLPEDDASMGESDDETRDPRELLGPVVRQFTGAWDGNGAGVRAFSQFAKCDVLSEYTASAQIRELKDPRMLAIFMHFIKVTGPTMSLYERHPFDHGDDEQFSLKPKGGNNLWTYTFPLISFNHPGLLHAMLALAALQIAKLQRVPPTAAMKHYHLAIRRIARNVRASSRRTQPPTLAASLLLAYFEVWSSDHDKWCNHLFGARILLRELPLLQMTRQCLPAKLFKQQQRDAESQSRLAPYFHGLNLNARSDLLILDYQLLTTITGQHITSAHYNLGEDQPYQPFIEHITARDIEQYENLRDLYWWYCKMDVYQSILGGTKLFMEYEHWTQCPPRSPISRLDAIYGTYDHLMLLLGRLANFNSKDQPRKRKASRGKFAPQGSGSPPPFSGMLPTLGKVRPPMGFTPPMDSSPQNDVFEDLDPEASFQSALREWDAIRIALEAFESRLGPEFQPLRPEYSDRRDSPFGMTLQYRTFSVAGLWMNFYMAMIYLHRAHPSMPPAAMQAAGVSAQKTAVYANNVGRVAAGLSDDCSQFTEISTLISAAFIESCFCLFVAGIQYQDDAQRHWLIRRLYDITRLTGWQSSKQIADGCESYWMKAAQMGRGPPYVRAPDLGMEVPTTTYQNPRRIDRKISELEPDEERPLVLAKSERAYYAMGLMSVEKDLELLELKDDV